MIMDQFKEIDFENINTPFLSEKGITDTQASRVADYAKLSYEELASKINGLKFYSLFIEKLDTNNSKLISKGVDRDTLNEIPNDVERIGALKALCAWLREAVKEHQAYINKSKSYSLGLYTKQHNITLPDTPQLESTISESDVLDSFDIKKRAHYYAVEAHAATIGQSIHKSDVIDKARKEYYKVQVDPRTIESLNGENIIYTKTPSVEKEDVENLFYGLQQSQAAYQKELNALKSEIQNRITNDAIDKRKAYNEARAKYDAEYQKINGEYALYTQEMQKKVANLKIVIPNSLQSIYDEITRLGKGDK